MNLVIHVNEKMNEIGIGDKDCCVSQKPYCNDLQYPLDMFNTDMPSINYSNTNLWEEKFATILPMLRQNPEYEKNQEQESCPEFDAMKRTNNLSDEKYGAFSKDYHDASHTPYYAEQSTHQEQFNYSNHAHCDYGDLRQTGFWMVDKGESWTSTINNNLLYTHQYHQSQSNCDWQYQHALKFSSGPSEPSHREFVNQTTALLTADEQFFQNNIENLQLHNCKISGENVYNHNSDWIIGGNHEESFCNVPVNNYKNLNYHTHNSSKKKCVSYCLKPKETNKRTFEVKNVKVPGRIYVLTIRGVRCWRAEWHDKQSCKRMTRQFAETVHGAQRARLNALEVLCKNGCVPKSLIPDAQAYFGYWADGKDSTLCSTPEAVETSSTLYSNENSISSVHESENYDYRVQQSFEKQADNLSCQFGEPCQRQLQSHWTVENSDQIYYPDRDQSNDKNALVSQSIPPVIDIRVNRHYYGRLMGL